MGVWDTLVTKADIGEGESTEWFELKPYEVAEVHWKRTDVGSSDTPSLAVYTSSDGGITENDVAVQEYWISPALNPSSSFTVEGPRYFKVTMTAALGSADAIVFTISITRNGGLT